ncbi:histidine kinase [Ichthyenterobacterium sp. W332]|uniref:Histidine kinase n=1 Tax=Microcosmobacter mediterraneus TaxID=3075607 RepID=A0ABU2YGS3_9FLAO|nr:histidine kinase [Ichthyenterobacterium sp. W332]MDT0557081.1 histidine kinase [Ichthyenterobacterium sp. W332]
MTFFKAIGQEKTTSNISDHFKIYESLKTDNERYEYLKTLNKHVKQIHIDSINAILKADKNNFVIQFALAEHLRVTKKYHKAVKVYLKLEQDILNVHPIDYELLSATVFYSTLNISLENFSFKEGLKVLYKGLDYAEKSKVDKYIGDYHSNIEYYNAMLANYKESFYHNKKAFEIAKKNNDTLDMIMSLKKLMVEFNSFDDSKNAIKIWNRIQPLLNSHRSLGFPPGNFYELATEAYINSKLLDSAKYYNNLGLKIDSINGDFYFYSSKSFDKGTILLESNKIEEAQHVFLTTYKLAKKHNNKRIEVMSSIELAKIHLNKSEPDKALTFLTSSYKLRGSIRNFYTGRIELWLSKSFEAKKALDSALYYISKSEKSKASENRNIAKRQAALAMIELDIDSYIDKNEELTQSNEALNQQVFKSAKTRNILIYSFLIIAILTGLFFYQKNQKEKLRISQYKEQLSNKERIAIEAELNSIRSQMNPHFMFNSLNSINEFIQNDSSEDASNYLVKFSRLMRSTLNYSKRKLVTLKEEIDLLKLYLELESLRFYYSIDYTFNIKDSINLEEMLIPPMMLQPFVENAIWHGLMAKDGDRKLNLRFFEKNNSLICEIVDNGIGRVASAKQNVHKKNHKSQGVGLTERRLELLKSIHGNEARVEIVDLYNNEKATGTLVKLILPKQQ